MEELLIEGGSLCIWGEWFGRPYDNFHAVKSVRWENDVIEINFSAGESLHISNPVKIVNEEKQLIIEDASKILFTWYYYGREQTYENLYIRQYIKNADGNIMRAVGKHRDVHENGGIIFIPKDKNAILIG